MAMKEKPRQVYKTMQGKIVDMHKLVQQNEMTVAVGNKKVNARGDELGPGGKIIRTREEIQRAAMNNTPGVPAAQAPTPPVPPAVKNVSNMDPEGNE